MQEIIFSGIKATGRLHIGNYLGAIKNWVELQESGKYKTIYSIVDLHSITIEIAPAELRENIFEMAVDLLAVGIKPEKSIFFVQSQVREHSELTWILNCLTPIAELNKMTQFKDKARQHKENINAGLFNYPVLMAADILLYRANLVPVGDDQQQHVELTRKIARKFNQRYDNDYFSPPKTLLTKIPRLMALNDPTKKMSKDLGKKSYIALSDKPDVIREKITRAVTDIGAAKDKAGGRNLLDIFNALVEDENVTAKFEEDYKNGELQYSKLKPMLSNVIINMLKPIQARRKELERDPDYIRQILNEGKIKATEIAEETMTNVKKIVGLL